MPVARFVKMTAMPQLVAIFNGVGGGAAALVSITEFVHIKSSQPATYVTLEVLLGVLIGTVSFSGSAIAFAKLQELMTGRPVTYPGQQAASTAWSGSAALVLIVTILVNGSTALLWILLRPRLRAGHAFVLPIGGADVPVLISLLNSFTGLAVAASGFTLGSNLLIVAGTLVGASGMLLTRMMSTAMGRSLPNILFSAFGSVVTASGATEREDGRSVRSGTPEDVGDRCSATPVGSSSSPATASRSPRPSTCVRELAEQLEAKGIEVFFAIHPVAGRMPGHMNVLLAEANVPYEQLKEMDEANSELQTADVALVVGANDTVNPAALDDKTSPIYGMPIIKRRPGREHRVPEALDASRLRGDRERAALQPQDHAGLRRRQGHPHQDAGDGQGLLSSVAVELVEAVAMIVRGSSVRSPPRRWPGPVRRWTRRRSPRPPAGD